MAQFKSPFWSWQAAWKWAVAEQKRKQTIELQVLASFGILRDWHSNKRPSTFRTHHFWRAAEPPFHHDDYCYFPVISISCLVQFTSNNKIKLFSLRVQWETNSSGNHLIFSCSSSSSSLPCHPFGPSDDRQQKKKEKKKMEENKMVVMVARKNTQRYQHQWEQRKM